MCSNNKWSPGEGSLPYIQGRGPTIDTADGGQHALPSILVPAPSREARGIVIVLSYHVPTVLSI
jgi:hypothetical protein